jgi:hypothetical protein
MHSEHQRAMLAQPAAGCHAVARCDGAACFPWCSPAAVTAVRLLPADGHLARALVAR